MLKILGMVAVPVVTIAGTIAALLYVVPMVTGQSVLSGGASANAPVVETVVVEMPEKGITYSAGERVVNLADAGGFRYLKTEIVLEIIVEDANPDELRGEALAAAREELKMEIEPLEPEIQDVITLLLSSKNVAEVSTPEGKSGLKAELLDALGEVIGEERLLDLYFTQFVIQ
ncbi:MAG: flagellar basal body-associated FliL family protein [Thermomicrobiales bacterium]